MPYTDDRRCSWCDKYQAEVHVLRELLANPGE
jgi:hypothetical protein